MRERLPLLLSALLVAAVVLQTWSFLERSRAERIVPIVLPYALEDLALPPPPGPPPPGGEADPGPVMTTDDVVRGLLVLSREGGTPLALTDLQRRRLLPLVSEAADHKERLLRLRQREEELQEALAIRGVRILETLSPEQVDYLLSNRDETERLLRRLPDLKARL